MQLKEEAPAMAVLLVQARLILSNEGNERPSFHKTLYKLLIQK